MIHPPKQDESQINAQGNPNDSGFESGALGAQTTHLDDQKLCGYSMSGFGPLLPLTPPISAALQRHRTGHLFIVQQFFLSNADSAVQSSNAPTETPVTFCGVTVVPVVLN